MRERIIYVADDGEECDSKEECEKWEYETTHLPFSIKWYDEDGEELIPTTAAEVETMYNSIGVFEILPVSGWEKDLDHMISYWGFGDRAMIPGRYLYIGIPYYDVYPAQDWRDEGYEILGWDEWVKLKERDKDVFHR